MTASLDPTQDLKSQYDNYVLDSREHYRHDYKSRDGKRNAR